LDILFGYTSTLEIILLIWWFFVGWFD